MTPITPDTCGTRGWIPARDFAFARDVTCAPLAIWEILRAAQAMPVVLARRADAWTAIAVMGTTGGRNALVAADGRWCAEFVPMSVRLHPFCLDTEGRLCLVPGIAPAAIGAPGVLPFLENGQLAPRLEQARRYMSAHARGVRSVGRALALLHDRRALLSGDETLARRCRDLAPGTEILVVDAERLAALADGDVLTLFRSGAMRWLHAHLDSLHRLDQLDRIARRADRTDNAGPPRVAAAEPDAVSDLMSAMLSDQGDADLRALIEGRAR